MMDTSKEFAQELQEGGIFLTNPAATEGRRVFDTPPKPLVVSEPRGKKQEGRNEFFIGIMVMLPISFLLWAAIVWFCKSFLF